MTKWKDEREEKRDDPLMIDLPISPYGITVEHRRQQFTDVNA